MINSPRSLLAHFTPFIPYCIDYANLIDAYLADSQRKKPFYSRLFPDGVTVDLGKMITPIAATMGLKPPEIKANWTPKVRSEISRNLQLTPGDRDQLYTTAKALQQTCIKNGAYARNIQNADKITPADVPLVQAAVKTPSSFSMLQRDGLEHGDLILVDANMQFQTPNSFDVALCDYPPLLGRSSDAILPVRMSEHARRDLESHDGFALGWHPFVRVLGRYCTLGESKPVLQLLQVSLRNPLNISDAIVADIEEEWNGTHPSICHMHRHVRHELLRKYQVILRVKKRVWSKLNESTDPALHFQELREKLVARAESGYSEIIEFENECSNGPIGFVAGLYYFVGTYSSGRFSRFAADIAHSVAKKSLLSPILRAEWKHNLDLIEPFEILRLTPNAIDEYARVISHGTLLTDVPVDAELEKQSPNQEVNPSGGSGGF